MRWRLGLCCVLAASFAPRTGRTAPPEIEEALIERGLALRESSRDAEALEVFRRAFEVHHSPSARAQIGFAEQALGHWVQAEAALSAVLRGPGDAWSREHQATLQTALDAVRAHLGWLELAANVPGASVSLNGSPAGVLPWEGPTRVVAGTVTIDVSAPDYVPQQRSTYVAPNRHAREFFSLAQAAAGASITRSDLRSAPTLGPPAIPTSAPRVDVPGMKTAAWFSVTIAAALGVSAATAWGIREFDVQAYNDDHRCFYGSLTRDQRCGDLKDAASTAQVVGTVALAAFGTTSAASLALFVWSSNRSDTRQSSVGCALGMRVRCTLMF